MLSDGHSRKIEYIRLSVSDLCNIRCRYCMPLEGAVKQDRKELLSFEEITRLMSVFAGLGVRSVRLTGGEPLVRKDLPRLLAMLHDIDGLDDILLTTNGYRLAELAPALKEAGLTRINIHLDTLNPEAYTQITRGGSIDDVLEGITMAQRVGLSPIKLNAVLLRGVNDGEYAALARFAAEQRLILRFIELMPIGPGRDMSDQFISSREVLENLSEHWTLLPYGKRLGPGPAEYYKIVELNSVIGSIHAVSEPFCDKCNRLRIAADGRIQDCLAYDEPTSLRTLLRTPGLNDQDLGEAIRNIVGMKREDHGGFTLPQYKPTCGMYGIGG